MELAPLVVFTMLSGLAAGAAAMSLLLRAASCPDGSKSPDSSARHRTSEPLLLMAICAAALALGLLASLAHLQQPLRFLNGLANPASMISRESYWCLALFTLLVICIIVSWRTGRIPFIIHLLCGAAGIGVMTVTSLAYACASGVPLWNDACTIPFFIVGDVLLGTATCLALPTPPASRRMIAGFLVLLVAVHSFIAAAITMNADASAGFSATVLGAVSIVAGIVSGGVALSTMRPSSKTCNGITPLIATAAFLALTAVTAARILFFASGVHL